MRITLVPHVQVEITESYRLGSGCRAEPYGTDPLGQGPKELMGACEGPVPDWAGVKQAG